LYLDEDRLRGFRAQIGDLVAGGAEVCLEHEVELTRLGEFALRGLSRANAWLFLALRRGDVVGAEAALAGLAVDHRIRETANVAGSDQHLLHREDGTVQAENVIALLDRLAPPVILEVALQFDAERAVVPTTVEPPVEFTGLEDEALALAKTDNLLHRFFGFDVLGHGVDAW